MVVDCYWYGRSYGEDRQAMNQVEECSGAGGSVVSWGEGGCGNGNGI